jgi:hypothetical protein
MELIYEVLEAYPEGYYKGVKQKTLSDVLSLHVSARILLGAGPEVWLDRGPSGVPPMPKRALMAFSPVFQKILSENPKAAAIILQEEQVSTMAYLQVTNFIRQNTRTMEPFILKPIGTVAERVQTYRFGRLLGWSKEKYLSALYESIESSLRYLWEVPDLKATLEELAQLNEDDELFQKAAFTILFMRSTGYAEEQEYLNTWLVNNPRVLKAVVSIDLKVKARTVSRSDYFS